MNAPVSVEAPHVVVAFDWRRLLPPLAGGLLLLGALFNQEVVAAFQTWEASTAYNHCFLVIPIALYLLWDRRMDLADVPIRPMPAALLLGLPLAAIWLLSERLGIMEGRQLAALSFAELLFLAVSGRQMWWASAGPLLYLYFLVPFGEFLTPRLQDITTFFIRHGLEVLDVPAYIDGHVIEIPQGTFFVAEACAGLRFLIASVAFGCLYALMVYRGPVRRTVFIVVSIIVPVIANGIRGIGIVYLGYLLGNAQAAAADHLIYGWVFFSAVILVLIMLGLPFRQDDRPTGRRGVVIGVRAPPFAMRGVLALVLGLVIEAAITPAVAARLTMWAAGPMLTSARVDVGSDCTVYPMAQNSEPAAVGEQLVTCGGVPMDLRWQSFSPRTTAGPMMAEQRRMVSRALTEGLSERWLKATAPVSSAAAPSRTTPGDGVAADWRVMESSDPPYIIAAAVWVDGEPARPGLSMRLRMALNSFTGSTFAPTIVTVTPAIDWSTRNVAVLGSAEDSLSRFLLAHPDLSKSVHMLSKLP